MTTPNQPEQERYIPTIDIPTFRCTESTGRFTANPMLSIGTPWSTSYQIEPASYDAEAMRKEMETIVDTLNREMNRIIRQMGGKRI